MPLYTVYGRVGPFKSTTVREQKAETIAQLHASFFGTKKEYVRVVYQDGASYGGAGPSTPHARAAAARFRTDGRSLTDCIVVQFAFQGTADVWASYCRALVQVYGGTPSIYLQKLDFEFEQGQEAISLLPEETLRTQTGTLGNPQQGFEDERPPEYEER